MLPKMDLNEVREYIRAQSMETVIYLGCDSERHKIDGVWYADFMLCVVVHIDGKHGGHIFGSIDRERDYDSKPGRPANRLMTEVVKVANLYTELQDVLEDRLVEIHCDINPNEMHGSSCVVQSAIGYIKGTCGMTPRVKPEAFCASYAADKLKFILQNQKEIRHRSTVAA